MSAAEYAPPAKDGRPSPGVFWLCAASVWLVLPLAGMGFLAWAGFLAVGFLARRGGWLSAGALYLAVLLVSFVMNEQAGPSARILLWAVSGLHALALNPAWLRNRWPVVLESGSRPAAFFRRASGPGTTAEPAPSAPAAPAVRRGAGGRVPAYAPGDERAAALLSDPVLDSSSYFDVPSPARPSTPAGPVDVNSAPVRDLQQLPGLSRSRARLLVKLRKERGPFRSLEDVAAALSLAPHEYARLRPLASCKLPPAGPPGFGRTVDY